MLSVDFQIRHFKDAQVITGEEIRIYFLSQRIGARLLKAELSARELGVLTFAVQGFTDDMIAHELGIQCGTVNSYWVRIRGKMGNLSRSELVARFVQQNADSAYSSYVETSDAKATSLAEENRQILARANAEIERLKELLAKEKG